MADDINMRVALLEQKVVTNNTFYQQRYEADQKAIEIALISVGQRLHAANDIKESLGTLVATMMPREEVTTIIGAVVERGALARDAATSKLEAQINPLAARIEQIGRPNWALLASFASVVGILLSGLFLIIGLKIDASAQPMALAIEQVKTIAGANSARIAAMDTRLNQLGMELSTAQQSMASFRATQVTNGGRITGLEERVSTGQAERRAAQATLTAQLVEVETQFRAVSTVVNLMKDDNHQMIGVFWSKLFPDAVLPPKNFRPNLYSGSPTQ